MCVGVFLFFSFNTCIKMSATSCIYFPIFKTFYTTKKMSSIVLFFYSLREWAYYANLQLHISVFGLHQSSTVLLTVRNSIYLPYSAPGCKPSVSYPLSLMSPLVKANSFLIGCTWSIKFKQQLEAISLLTTWIISLRWLYYLHPQQLFAYRVYLHIYLNGSVRIWHKKNMKTWIYPALY